VARGGTLLILALIGITPILFTCTGRFAPTTQRIGEWAEENGYQWSEGPDEIRTNEGFFNYIDGAAEPIIALGWKRSVFGTLEKETRRLRLTIHQMDNPRAATALFGQNAFQRTEPVAVGERGIYWDRGLFSKGIIFQKKNVLCELIGEKQAERGTLLVLASSLAGLIE
jgi:hypothetical protein